MEKIPFWEETYRKSDINTFPAEPNGTILEFEHLLKKDSAILEAGCGEGQNVRYLAKNGYSDIDAFDLSEAGISKLKWFCERERLRINAFVDDLTKYHFTKSYDLVMTFATLCFVEKDKWRHFIEDAKEHTKPNGIHIIHTFTNTVPASPDIAPFAVGLADEGEILNLYPDWEVLQFKTYVFDDEHPGVPKHRHAVNKLVARKKASCCNNDVMLDKITFPEHEYESVQSWLNKQGYCYTTRVYKEVGKYKVGESYLAPWGEILRIDEIQTYRKVSDRPFCDEMSDAEKEEIRRYSEDMGLPYEFIRFSKSKTD